MLDDRYIFIHIPKTGGTTLSNIAIRQYLPWEIFKMNLSKGGIIKNIKKIKNKRKLKLIFGHIGYGTNKDLRSDFKYITFLRNPVDVFISNFYYIKFDKNNSNSKLLENMFLHDYIDSNECRANILTSYLSSHNWSEYQRPEMLKVDFRQDIAPVSEKHYEEALHVLKNELQIFGITEKFDESLLLFKEHLQWKFPYYVPLLKTKNKLIPSADEIQKIKDINKYDIELYKIALDIFDKQFSSIQKADKKLKKFKARNKIYGYPMMLFSKFYGRLFSTL